MDDFDYLKRIEGKQTIETIADALKLSRQSALNLISKLKKKGYVSVSGGRYQKRIYDISTKARIKKTYPGMFDILNKHSKEKIIPPFNHSPHFHYKIENAITDLADFDEIRIIVNILPLFNHVKNWKLLYALSKKKKIEKKIGALYDIAKQSTKVRKMPKKTRTALLNSKKGKDFMRSSEDFKETEKFWKINIPFNHKDLEVHNDRYRNTK